RISLLNLLDLVAYNLPASVLVLQQRPDLAGTLPLVRKLVLNDENLQACEPIQLQFEDRVCLFGIEIEALHDFGRRIDLALRLSDDSDDLVEGFENLFEALE